MVVAINKEGCLIWNSLSWNWDLEIVYSSTIRLLIVQLCYRYIEQIDLKTNGSNEA